MALKKIGASLIGWLLVCVFLFFSCVWLFDLKFSPAARLGEKTVAKPLLQKGNYHFYLEVDEKFDVVVNTFSTRRFACFWLHPDQLGNARYVVINNTKAAILLCFGDTDTVHYFLFWQSPAAYEADRYYPYRTSSILVDGVPITLERDCYFADPDGFETLEICGEVATIQDHFFG